MIPFNHEFKHVVASDELDVWGNPTGDITVVLYGNLRSQMGIARDSNGEEKSFNYTALFEGIIDIKQGDRIEFIEPNGETVRLEPIQIKFMRGLDGNVKYTKVVL